MININIIKPKLNINNIISTIDLDILLKNNIKALILDVDDTIISGNNLNLCNHVNEWIIYAKEYFEVYLYSNNISKKRVSSVAEQLSLRFTYAASKPRIKPLKKFINMNISYPYKNIAMIGDRIFTDIIAGNRVGLFTILVDPIDENGYKKHNWHFQTMEKSIAKFLLGAEL